MNQFHSIKKKCLCLCFLLALVSVLSCNSESGHKVKINESKYRAQTYATWRNLCFDRAASIWLIRKFVDTEAKFKFQEFGTKIIDGTPFDVPGAELGRQRSICCFESIIQKYRLSDSSILKMSKIIHDIDVNKWGVKLTKGADSLEKVFMDVRKKSTSDDDLLEKTKPLFQNMYSKFSR